MYGLLEFHSTVYFKRTEFSKAKSNHGADIPKKVLDFLNCKINDEMFMEEMNSLNRLENVVIPDGVSEISIGMFKDCMNLKSITIPKSVNEIKSYAFSGCISLIEVYFEGSKEEWNRINIGSFNTCLKSAVLNYNK